MEYRLAEEMHKFSTFKQTKENLPAEGAFKRYFQKIQSFFSGSEGTIPSLHGRIREVEDECEELSKELTALKEDASKVLEAKLGSQFALVIDGAIKDLSRIQRESARGHDMQDQAMAGNRYQAWIEQARTLLFFKREFAHPKKILNYVIDYNIDEFQKRIDRDLQLIEDYLNHAMMEEGEDEQEGEGKGASRNEVNRSEVVKEIDPVLVKLHGLKVTTDMTTIDQLIEWKLISDHMRGEHFSEALHIIDCVFHRSEFGHVTRSFLGEGHAIEKRIGIIEEHVEQLKEACEGVEQEFDEEDNPYSSLANQLEMEAREINRDPDILPSEKEKIQKIIRSLDIFRKNIS